MHSEAAWLDLAPMSRAEGVVALPGSKSISNRSLLLAALSSALFSGSVGARRLSRVPLESSRSSS